MILQTYNNPGPPQINTIIKTVVKYGFGGFAVNGLSQPCRLLALSERLTPVYQSGLFLVLIHPMIPLRPPYHVLRESRVNRLSVFSDKILDDWGANNC